MTSFVGGPADGVHLALARAPLFLRVTRDGEVFDALDQLEDVPAPGEEIAVYRLLEGAVRGVACSRTKGHGCRAVTFARYRFWVEQPDASTLRNAERWRAWCQGQKGP